MKPSKRMQRQTRQSCQFVRDPNSPNKDERNLGDIFVGSRFAAIGDALTGFLVALY